MGLDAFYKELDAIFRTKDVRAAENYIMSAMETARDANDLPSLLAMANELGGIYRVTGRFDEAKGVYAAALDYIRLLDLSDTDQHGTTLLNLASVLSESGDAAGALTLYGRVGEIYGRHSLDGDYRMAALHNNMSHALERLERLDEAVDHAERAMAIIKKLPGHETELATAYSTLASRYIRKQRYEDAEKCLGEAEKIFRSKAGRPDVHFAATLNALGELRFRQGDFAGAADYFAQALSILRDAYGENRIGVEVAANLARANAAMPAGSGRMSGMALSEAFFKAHGRPMLRERFAFYEKYMAIGLVGEGSDCFGFDDVISESHDFGPGFCIWLPDDIDEEIGQELRKAYESLPKTFGGHARNESPEGAGRVGVFSIGGFYKKYIGFTGVPQRNVDWLFLPETSLATVTNGKIFQDDFGEFTKIREGLLAFYPDDIRLKKIAARMAMMSQAGQYNYSRCVRRGDYSAAYMSCAEFVRAAVSMVYLLNRRYMPFYKWMFRGMEPLEILGDVRTMTAGLAALPDTDANAGDKLELIEAICMRVRDELAAQGLVTGADPFLNSHAGAVMARIADPQIRNLPVLFDGR